MIDPVIFTIGNFSLRWYGVIVMTGVIVGSLIVEAELRRRGENPESIWDALVWRVSFGPVIKTPIGNFQLGLPLGVLPVGIIGARLWYVLNATLGGSRFYIENPSHIYKIWEGGLHIYGGILLGSVVLILFLRSRKLDTWLFLDAAGPALFVGQAIGRIANFINQELYGQPTTLPWGIKIEAIHRLSLYQDLNLYPVETTRFHPTFAYEMIWNLAVAGLLLWMSRRYEKEFKPGAIFSIWLTLAGIGRIWVEFFRPDQPKIEALGISYTTVAAAVMSIIGVFLLLVRYKAINLAFAETWEEEYQISGQEKPQASASTEPEDEEQPAPVKRKASTTRAKKAMDDEGVKKTAASRKTTDKGTKKSS